MMKKRLMLPLVAAISTVMVGCGGGGGGDSSPSTPKTTFTFNFLKAKSESAATNLQCRIYKEFEEQGEDMVLHYYSLGNALDQSIIAYYSDENGVKVGDSIYASSGKLSIVLESMPDDGYVTIQEFNGTIINATTLSKSLLSTDSSSLRSVDLSITGNTQTTSCISGSNDVETSVNNLEYDNAPDSSGSKDSNYYFDSQLDTVTLTNPKLGSTNLKKITAEKTMITQYRTSDRTQLFQYGFSGWNNDVMSFAGSQKTPEYSNYSQIDFQNIDISLIYSGFRYALATIDKNASFYHPQQTNAETWVFDVQGGIATPNWESSFSDAISDMDWILKVDDINLFDASGVNDSNPSVSSGVIDVSASIGVSDENGIQRVTYEQGTTVGTTPYVLRHTLYTEIRPQVLVPELEYGSIPGEASKDLVVSNSSQFHQSYLFTENSNDVSIAEFMSQYSHSESKIAKDEIGVLKSLVEMRDIENNILQTKTLMLLRPNS
ncbi:flagellar sheath protein A [Vibrio sp. 10N.286.49.B1]|uniref:flagellar sheath protein A n=1 Tax=unclassified Vibrio TaxID=2614977 RepID=UPI00105547A3|nr:MULTISPECIES: flagellar sheath protein A [unclassified Vibrio]